MKVVLFCGGAGMRLRGYSEDVPKPMVTIGARPVLWHVMKYYAHFGHKDFVICLGYKATSLRTISSSTRNLFPTTLFFPRVGDDLSSCSVTSTTGESLLLILGCARLSGSLASGRAISGRRGRLSGQLQRWLTDFPLPQMIDDFSRRDGYASFLSVQPSIQQSGYRALGAKTSPSRN